MARIVPVTLRYDLHHVHYNMGLVVTKSVFGVSEKARHKPVSLTTETSLKTEISLVASFDIVLYKKQITKALIRLRGCAGWSVPVLFTNPRRQVFSRRGPYCTFTINFVNFLILEYTQYTHKSLSSWLR